MKIPVRQNDVMIYEMNTSTMSNIITTLNSLHQLLSPALEEAYCVYIHLASCCWHLKITQTDEWVDDGKMHKFM